MHYIHIEILTEDGTMTPGVASKSSRKGGQSVGRGETVSVKSWQLLTLYDGYTGFIILFSQMLAMFEDIRNKELRT